jgi:hypothetical protein
LLCPIRVSLRERRAAANFYRSGSQDGRDKLDTLTLAKHTGQLPRLICRDEKGKGRFAYVLNIIFQLDWPGTRPETPRLGYAR